MSAQQSAKTLFSRLQDGRVRINNCCGKIRDQSPEMAILFFLAEEPVRNDEQQDCCLIVEVHAPDWINQELVQLATEEAIEDTFGKRLTLWSANRDEASQHLQGAPDATRGYLEFWAGAPLIWYLVRIV